MFDVDGSGKISSDELKKCLGGNFYYFIKIMKYIVNLMHNYGKT